MGSMHVHSRFPSNLILVGANDQRHLRVLPGSDQVQRSPRQSLIRPVNHWTPRHDGRERRAERGVGRPAAVAHEELKHIYLAQARKHSWVFRVAASFDDLKRAEAIACTQQHGQLCLECLGQPCLPSLTSSLADKELGRVTGARLHDGSREQASGSRAHKVPANTTIPHQAQLTRRIIREKERLDCKAGTPALPPRT